MRVKGGAALALSSQRVAHARTMDPHLQPPAHPAAQYYHPQQVMHQPPPQAPPPQQQLPTAAAGFLKFPKAMCTFDGSTFSVDPRYSIRCRVGQGAQGVICSAVDLHQPEGTEVAVKKLPNALDEVMASKRLLRELRLLRHLRHENILSLSDIMLPPSTNVLLWKDVYIVSELMDTDLHYVIHSKQPLSEAHTRYFLYQVPLTPRTAATSRVRARQAVGRCAHPRLPASILQPTISRGAGECNLPL